MKPFKVLALSRYSNRGASSRFRIFQYIPTLQLQKDQPVKIQVQSLFGDEYLDALYDGHRHWGLVFKFYFQRLFFLITKPKADVLWIEKELFPWMPAFAEKLLLKYLGVPYVLDYDDAIFHNYDLNPRFLVRAFFSSKHPELMKSSAAVIAGNSYLAKKAKDSGAAQVIEIPTVVSSARYLAQNQSEQRLVGRPVIGWIGSPSTAKYLEIVHPLLRKLAETHAFDFQVVGAKLEWPDLKVNNIKWSEATEVASIQNFDIGIMPLADSPWERGKCGFKLVQYMACGKPVVASNVGCNPEIVIDNETGFIARTDDDWVKSLRELLDHPEKRRQMGQAGRERFKKLYSLEQQAPSVLDTLQKASRSN